MMTGNKKTTISWKEILFQIILHIVVFIFYYFDKKRPGVELSQIAFFLTYTLAAFVINYVLLPTFFYRKKYFAFFIWTSILAAAIILMEELIWEPLFFPDTRAQSFPGIFFTLLHILPVITILSGFKFAWDSIGKQRKVEELEATVKESELQFLKSQINPHFLFNNMNNLYSHALEGSTKTPEIILELSGVLRYILYECKEKFVPLLKEIEQLHNFIKLNKLQIENRGKVIFKVENTSSGYTIAPLILTVFLENAFKHSTASQSKDIVIDIRVQVTSDGELTFQCKNTFDAQTNTDDMPHGIGLRNVKKRLELLYPKAYKLNITDKDNWYAVNLAIKLKKAKK